MIVIMISPPQYKLVFYESVFRRWII